MKLRSLLRKRLVQILVFIFVMAVAVTLFWFYGRDPQLIERLAGYGYLGAFLISLIGNASVFLFLGAVLPLLAGIGVVLYPATGITGPIIVGLVGGVGAAIGEITGYLLGFSGRAVVENNRRYEQLVGWMRKWGVIAIFLLSAVPFFFDIVAIGAGVLRVPLWKFVIACWLGRTFLYVVAVVLTALGWEIISPVLGW